MVQGAKKRTPKVCASIATDLSKVAPVKKTSLLAEKINGEAFFVTAWIVTGDTEKSTPKNRYLRYIFAQPLRDREVRRECQL